MGDEEGDIEKSGHRGQGGQWGEEGGLDSIRVKQRNDERVGHKEKGNLPLLKRYKEWTIRIGCIGNKSNAKGTNILCDFWVWVSRTKVHVIDEIPDHAT